MDVNFISVFVAALIPLAVGFVWYNPKVFGNAWMQASGMTEEKAKGANHALIFGLTYVFAVLAGMALMPIVIHQMGIFSVLADDPGMKDPNSEVSIMFNGFMQKYGDNFRTFKHGAFHGTLLGIFMVLPIIAINAMFERKSWKYIWINVGYFTVSFALMGGVICAWK
ncbi:MAG TPA: DUF1761 domain-containing protein [Bacteroidia bacterium]|nr:DUF1761 domain-containing protein [Bacteroidia bacterium]HNU33036.1 DUF1761 domain-containing protein [Bacteroidia bacterium]